MGLVLIGYDSIQLVLMIVRESVWTNKMVFNGKTN